MTKMVQQSFGIKTRSLADQRQVKVIVATAMLARDGDILEPAGIDLSAFKRSPTVLWQHDANHPIARCIEIGLEAGDLVATTQFPKEGTSATSDTAYGLILEGVVNSVSIGFMPTAAVPIDPKKPYGGQRFTKAELYEFSFVSVPADRGALIVARGLANGRPDRDTREGRLRAARQLRANHLRDVHLDSVEQQRRSQDASERERHLETLKAQGFDLDTREGRQAYARHLKEESIRRETVR